MFGAFFFLFGLMPLLIGVFAWSLVRRRDEGGPDDPPPPPEPERPQPVVPPSLRRRDREPVRTSPVRARWSSRRRRV